MMPDSSNKSLDEVIKLLPKKELEKLVLKAASKHKEFDVFLRLTYLDKKEIEKDLYNDAINDINQLMHKNYKGFSQELQLANMLTACNKRASEFSKVCKNKKAEADLLMLLLEIPFKHAPRGSLGTCFTAYDYKVTIILKKLITLVNSKLHPDYKIDYSDKINEYLTILHACSNHNDFIYFLPKYI
jgi:hypothetical protein